MELSKFGRIDSLNICDNLGDHMVGHVYCKFFDEEEAADALQIMNGRYYDGRKMAVEYSPVTDFREARCRDYDDDQCSRGGFCNFMHVRPVPECLIRSLEEEAENERHREAMERRGRDGERGRRGRSRSRSSSSSSDDNSRDGGRRSRDKRSRRERSGSGGRRPSSRSRSRSQT
jgi:splicing factor U2AF subunit